MDVKILDCTLRDGGYYTNWDFSDEIVSSYIKTFESLPIDYLEVGYRSNPMIGYLGKYFYCPVSILETIKSKTTKKLAIILNEKDVRAKDVGDLLTPIKDLVDMIRIAIDPDNFIRAIGLAKEVKKIGFEVAFNVMYMSTWKQNKIFLDSLSHVNGLVDYFYMVDSYGGVYPQDVKEIIQLVRSRVSVELGFHGHNNLEMALANTLVAIDEGVDIVDATVTGMGRGAGNLKTELLLTALNGKSEIEVDFNQLSKIVDLFTDLQKQYEWGTNLPYMVSGANSLPQKQVMEWVSKRFYSFGSIIQALNNKAASVTDNIELPKYDSNISFDNILVVGGGPSVREHAEGIRKFLSNRDKTLIIHSSSRNVPVFKGLSELQLHCLSGNEGHRLESVFEGVNTDHRKLVLPPYPRMMGTYIPSSLASEAYELSSIGFSNKYLNSITSVVLEIVRSHNPKNIYVVGYDGYNGSVSKQQIELFQENEYLFKVFTEATGLVLNSLLPTTYNSLTQDGLYKYL